MSAGGPDNALSPWDPRWTAADGTSWRVRLAPDLIEFISDEQRVPVVKAHWARDLMIVRGGDAVIIRLETFERSLVFQVAARDARPLLNHVGYADEAAATVTQPTPPPTRTTDLLWPKVSPLAVWALVCGALAFLPIAGAVPGVACVVLLILHRTRVRRAAAYRHSRVMCAAAFTLLVTGLVVSLLGTLGLVRNAATREDSGSVPVLLRQGLAPFEAQDERRTGHDDERRQGAIPTTAESTATPSPAETSNPVAPARAVFGGELPAERGTELLAQSHLADTNWAMVAAVLFVVLLSLTVHEAAHAISAWWLGDDFARRLGRVTLNPLSHIDPFGTVILPLILFLVGGNVFGWAKPVPVRLDYVPRPRRAQILIALAGPGSNLILACLSLSMLLGIGSIVPMLGPEAELSGAGLGGLDDMTRASGFPLAPLVGPLCVILRISFFANVFLAFFNLIPIPPLDGSWVLQYSFPRTLGPIYERLRPYSFWIFVGLLYANVLDYLLEPAAYVAVYGLALVTLCTGS